MLLTVIVVVPIVATQESDASGTLKAVTPDTSIFNSSSQNLPSNTTAVVKITFTSVSNKTATANFSAILRGRSVGYEDTHASFVLITRDQRRMVRPVVSAFSCAVMGLFACVFVVCAAWLRKRRQLVSFKRGREQDEPMLNARGKGIEDV